MNKTTKNIREERPDLIMYSLPEVAELLGKSHKTVWRYVRDGKIKAVKIGSTWRVSASEYKRFVGED